MPSSDLIDLDTKVKGVSEPSCFNFGTSGTRRFGICRSSLHLTEGNYLAFGPSTSRSVGIMLHRDESSNDDYDHWTSDRGIGVYDG